MKTPIAENIRIIDLPGAKEMVEKLTKAKNSITLKENFYPLLARHAKTQQSPKLVGITFSLAMLKYAEGMSGLKKLKTIRSIPINCLVDALVNDHEAAEEIKDFVRKVADSLDYNLPMRSPGSTC